MPDAWEILTANATDTTDAWAALNSQQTSSGTPGTAVNEIPFSLGETIQLTSLLAPQAITATAVAVEPIQADFAAVDMEYATETEALPILEVL